MADRTISTKNGNYSEKTLRCYSEERSGGNAMRGMFRSLYSDLRKQCLPVGSIRKNDLQSILANEECYVPTFFHFGRSTIRLEYYHGESPLEYEVSLSEIAPLGEISDLMEQMRKKFRNLK